MKNIKKIEDNIVKDVGNLLRLEKETDDTTIKDIRNPFRRKKNVAVKDRVLRDIRNLIEHEEEEEKSYYKPVRECNFWSNTFIEYDSNGDRNKTLSIKE